MAATTRTPTHRADGAPAYFRGVRRLPAVSSRLAVATGGAVVAAGLGAGGLAPAQATTDMWDAVAQCESGGNWSINTGNGYHGGLQFSRSTWQAFGGTEYAVTADRASKAQQIAIAQRTLHGQGPGAWPTCGKRAGLTKANGGADPNAQPGGGSGSGGGGSTTPSTPSTGALVVDGKFGPQTTRALEKWIGVSEDGRLSTTDIKALQSKVGATADGKIGAETTRKLRAAIGLSDNGAWDFRSNYASVKALQQFLNSGAPASGGNAGGGTSAPSTPSTGTLVVDGKFGPQTTRALEAWIGVSQDGRLSTNDIKALQRKIGATPDGKIGAETTGKLRQAIGLSSNGVWDFRTSYATVKALQTHLNAA